MVSSSGACKLLTSRSTEATQVGIFYHSIRNWKIGLSKRGRLFLNFVTATFIKLSCGRGFWPSESNLEVFFSSLISHSGTFRPSSRLDPNFAFDGGISIAAITQAIANIPTIPPLVSFFLFIFFKFYWFIDDDRIVICLFFSRRKAEKVWWSRAVWLGGEDGLSRFTRNGDQIVFLSEAERNEEYRVYYFISFLTVLECFTLRASLLLRQEDGFFWASLAVLTQEGSLRRVGEGKERKIKGNLHYLLLGFFPDYFGWHSFRFS